MGAVRKVEKGKRRDIDILSVSQGRISTFLRTIRDELESLSPSLTTVLWNEGGYECAKATCTIIFINAKQMLIRYDCLATR
jgi:hypothetical protein